jgi:hypothetical protein
MTLRQFQTPPFDVFTGRDKSDRLLVELRSSHMRFVLIFLSSLLFWSMTISIEYGNRNPSTTSAAQACSGEVNGEVLLDYLHIGRIKGIRDNGQILTVGLPSDWATLTPDIQQETYEAVACYAKTQQRKLQIIETQ